MEEIDVENVYNVTIDQGTDITATTACSITPENPDLTVDVVKKEYSIVGDGLYASINADEAPQWLTSIIDDVVGAAVANELVNYDDLVQDVRSAIEALDVAANTYVEQINFDVDVNAIISTRLTTLNATLENTYATIIGLEAAVANADFALTQAVSDLTAAYTADITSQITTIQTAYTDADNALASDITALTVSFTDQEANLVGVADAVTTLETYVGVDPAGTPDGTGMLSRINILEKQNDGIIEYSTGTYDVMLNMEDPNTRELDVTQEPYATWIATDTTLGTEETRASHVGDVYIKYTSAVEGYKTYDKAYKFIKTVVDGTSPFSTDSEGYTWSLVVDTDAQNAYIVALNAYDLADNKRRVFTQEPVGPYEIGDLWVDATTSPQVIKTSTADRVSGYLVTEWIIADEQANFFITNTYEPDSAQLHRQLDGQIEYLFYESFTDVVGATDEATALALISAAWTTQAIKDNKNGNIAYFKDTTNAYWYQASTPAWLTVADTSIYQALQDAATAQSTADGVVVSYYAWDQTTAPATTVLWFADDNLLYRYVTNQWVVIPAKEGDTLVAYDEPTKDVTFYEYRSGTWARVTSEGIVASAKAVTDLSLALSTLDDDVFGVSGLEQSLSGAITDEGARVESKFEYNSVIGLNGTYYDAGFGLVTTLTGGTGTEGDPYSSEFWIDAEKFRFTNSAQTGTATPFTIDASGATPQITFDGVVDFTNTDMSSYDNSNVNLDGNNDAFAQNLGYTDYAALVTAAGLGKTVISGGYINTDLLEVGIALTSADGLFSIDMGSKILHSENASGSYTELEPTGFRCSNGTTNLFEFDGTTTTLRKPDGSILLASGVPLNYSDVSGGPVGAGGNMINNSAFESNSHDWALLYNTTGFGTSLGINFAGSAYQPSGTNALCFRANASPVDIGTNFFVWAPAAKIPVKSGTRIEASVYLVCHRCTAGLVIAFYESSGTYISAAQYDTGGPVAGGETDLNNWARVGGFLTVPAGAAYAEMRIRMQDTTGTEWPYAWATRFFVAEALAAQTALSPWSAGSSIADVTGDVVGDVAYLDQVTGTYIANLAVDTIHVAGHAISAPIVGTLANTTYPMPATLSNGVVSLSPFILLGYVPLEYGEPLFFTINNIKLAMTATLSSNSSNDIGVRLRVYAGGTAEANYNGSIFMRYEFNSGLIPGNGTVTTRNYDINSYVINPAASTESGPVYFRFEYFTDGAHYFSAAGSLQVVSSESFTCISSRGK